VLGAITAAQAQGFYHYQCDDGGSFEVVFYPETRAAYLQIDGKSPTLPKSFSLISQRFSKNGVALSMRGGGKAILKRAGKRTTCQVK
jgi:hypothetical protein